MLEQAGIAYLSIAEVDWPNAADPPEAFRCQMRSTFSGRIIYAGLYTASRAERLLEAGLADFVAFGRPLIAHPYLPRRIANGWPLNALNAAALYGGDEQGFTDYPRYIPAQTDVEEAAFFEQRIDGKVVMITEDSTGIGAEVARLLAARGAKVAIEVAPCRRTDNLQTFFDRRPCEFTATLQTLVRSSVEVHLSGARHPALH